jgi:hypothetical protein
MRWNTSQLVKDLGNLPSVAQVINTGKEGYGVSDCLQIQPKGSADRLYLQGFVTDGDVRNPADDEVELLEFTDRIDESTALSNETRANVVAYYEIKGYLEAAGFEVVHNLRDYF